MLGVEGNNLRGLRGIVLPSFNYESLQNVYILAPPSSVAIFKVLYYVYPAYQSVADVLRHALAAGIEFSLAWDRDTLNELQDEDIEQAAETGQTLKDVHVGYSLRAGSSEALIDWGYQGGNVYKGNWLQRLNDLVTRVHIRGLGPEASVEKWVVLYWRNPRFLEEFMCDGPSLSLTSLALGDSDTLVSASNAQLKRDRITDLERALIRGASQRTGGRTRRVSLYPATWIMRLELPCFWEGVWNYTVDDLLAYISQEIKNDNPIFCVGKTDREWRKFINQCSTRPEYKREFVVGKKDVQWGVTLMERLYTQDWNGHRVGDLKQDLPQDEPPSM